VYVVVRDGGNFTRSGKSAALLLMCASVKLRRSSPIALATPPPLRHQEI
jgi:hypothetical protein